MPSYNCGVTMVLFAGISFFGSFWTYGIVNAYQLRIGMMALITPTGLVLASLAMVNVTFDKWLKFVMPLLGMPAVLSSPILLITTYLLRFLVFTKHSLSSVQLLITEQPPATEPVVLTPVESHKLA